MFNVMNEKEMMNVNGGFYYVCWRFYKTMNCRLVYIGMSVVQVASGSGEKDRTYVDGKRIH